MSNEIKYKFGTKEWATESKGIYVGCKNNCEYCYQRANMCKRWKKRLVEDWPNMHLNPTNFNEKPYLIEGRLMFPSTHDIFLEILPETIDYLNRWLEVGNEILIVSKPRFIVIEKLCKALEHYKDKIIFRFTIGSRQDEVLQIWEPNAPSYKERLLCLEHAKINGYHTSVSIEPYLDDDVIGLAEALLPFVTDTIWVGKMNEPGFRVDIESWPAENKVYYYQLLELLSDEFVEKIYQHFKDNPQIRWKESIKKVVNLPDEEIG
jgi:hypothetical protein